MRLLIPCSNRRHFRIERPLVSMTGESPVNYSELVVLSPHPDPLPKGMTYLTNQPGSQPERLPESSRGSKRSADPRSPSTRDSHPEGVSANSLTLSGSKIKLASDPRGIATLNSRLLSRGPTGCLDLSRGFDYLIRQVCRYICEPWVNLRIIEPKGRQRQRKSLASCLAKTASMNRGSTSLFAHAS